MPRRREIPRRDIQPDPVFNSELVTRFINCMMLKGKKSISESIFYGALDRVKQKANEDPLKIFKKAVDNVKPVIEVKSRRVGGATYQVPVEVSHFRRVSLSIRWLIWSARKRGEKSMSEKLAAEFLDASNHRGNSFKKKEDTHRMAEANKAFAHFRW